jgi:hypothetical protein
VSPHASRVPRLCRGPRVGIARAYSRARLPALADAFGIAGTDRLLNLHSIIAAIVPATFEETLAVAMAEDVGERAHG